MEHKKIDFSEYMKLLAAIAAEPVLEKEITPEPTPDPTPDTSPVSEPEEPTLEPEEPAQESKSSRVLDFLRQFSSIPKSQSIKID